MPCFTTTQLVMRSKSRGAAIRVAFLESLVLLDPYADRHLCASAMVAYFAGAETVRRWRPTEVFHGSHADWAARKGEILSGLEADWETILVRRGMHGSASSLTTALGGSASLVLGPGFEAAYDVLISPAASQDDHDWRSTCKFHWDRAWGTRAYRAEQALRSCRERPNPFATATPCDAKAPHAPIHVSLHEVEVRDAGQSLRYAVVENEGRLLNNGKCCVGAVIAGLRGHSTFSRWGLEVVEEPRERWEVTRARRLKRWGERPSSFYFQNSTTFNTREDFVDAVGPRFLRAIGGQRAMDVLAPSEAPRRVLPVNRR